MSGRAYWRIYVTANNGAGDLACQLAEIIFKDQYGANISMVGATISVSSSYSGYPASNLIDGNLSTSWATATALFPAYIVVQFTIPQLVGLITITATDPLNRSPNVFHVDCSDDGVTWTTLSSFSGIVWNVLTTRTFTIPWGTLTDPISIGPKLPL